MAKAAAWYRKYSKVFAPGNPLMGTLKTKKRVFVTQTGLSITSRVARQGRRARGPLDASQRFAHLRSELPAAFVGRADQRIAYALPEPQLAILDVGANGAAECLNEFLALSGGPPIPESPGALLRLSPRRPGAPSAPAA